MAPTKDSYLAFTFGIPIQRWIYDQLLALLGRGSAAFFRDACWLMSQDPKIETAVHVVGHLFRELEGQLRSLVIDQAAVEARLQQKMSERRKCEASQNETLKLTHQEEIDIILTQWNIPSDDPMAKLWLKRIKKDPLHKFAHHRMLGSARSSDEGFEKIIEEWEAVFRFILESTQRNYTMYHSRLDELLSKEIPTTTDLQTLRESVPNSLHAMTYFFLRLSHAQWIQLLRAKGYFNGPPDPEWDSEKGTSFFPYWPQAHYLTKMAAVKPAEMMDIILNVKDKGNPYVQRDLIQAAMQMPGSIGSKMVPKVLGWLQKPRYRFFTQDCAELVSYLGENGQPESALAIAAALFAPEPFKAASAGIARDLTWDYGKGLEQCMPLLIKSGDTAAFRMLCNLLNDARRAEYGEKPERQHNDLSHHDRPRLEVEPRRGEGSVEDALISAIRDTTTRLATRDHDLIPELVRELESQKWAVFHRLSLYLLSQFAQHAPGLAIARMKEFHRYDSDCYHNEYYSLVKAVFPFSDATGQGSLLITISAGPNLAEIRALIRASGQEITSDAVTERVCRWKRDRLGALRPVLNAPWRCRLQELEEKLGPAQSLITLDRITIREHPAPEKANNFPQMDVDAIVVFLREWRPSMDFPRQSPEPVFKGLQKAVVSGPTRFAEQADLFRQVDVSYIRYFLEGLKEALTQQASFPWHPVIELCRWITQQGLSIPGRTRDDFYWDRDWGYTRKSVLGLIRAAFKSGSNRIPLELRPEIWEILETLSEDPEPSAEQERERVGLATGATQIAGGAAIIRSHEDPIALASGTTRPQAIKAVIDYAVWVKRNLVETGHTTQEIGLSSVPEARQLLERHLSPDIEPSVAVASVFGRRFADLYYLDTEWIIANKGKIFPADEALYSRREAAWESFIIFSRPRRELFEVLEAEYVEAVEALATRVPLWRQSLHHPEYLGIHLWNLYIWGTVELESHQEILRKFYERAADDLIGKLHWKIGWEFHEDRPVLGEPEFIRVQALWEWRLISLPDNEYGDEHISECQAYGVWFSSGRFSCSKALDLLEKTFKKTGRIKLESSVLDTLASAANDMPEEVLRCGLCIVSRIEERWQLTRSKAALEIILSNTMNHESETVSRAAHQLRALLVAKGLTEFATSAAAQDT